jgi:hypothetical protein
MERLGFIGACWLVAAATTTAACNGVIGPPGKQGSQSGIAGATGNGASGTAGGTGTVTGAAGTGTVTGAAGTGTVTGAAGMGTATGTGGSQAIVYTQPSQPGTMVMRRLSAAEYDNTVRDLLFTTKSASATYPLPTDGSDSEFSNIGSALSLTPDDAERYETAGYGLVDELLADATRKAKIVTCNIDTGGDTCAGSVLKAFARRAWRRPVTDDEAKGLLGPLAVAKQVGATPTQGLRYALASVLLSPYFVFKVERDANPTSTTPRRLNGHELATRLSYALWGTMPDSMLFAAADADQLGTDDQLAAHVNRMLSDPKAAAIVDEFAGAWLDFEGLENHGVDTKVFPKYEPALATAMKAEVKRFVEEFLRQDMPITKMMDGGFTFLDGTLATHYGMSPPPSTAAGQLARVDLTGGNRIGLLTMGAYLVSTSKDTRTATVLRGQYVYNRLLCGALQFPGIMVPPLPEDPNLTGRQAAEQHASNPACSGCHMIMDQIGFAFEKFDAIGAYRETEAGQAIRTDGQIPDHAGGYKFEGPLDLSRQVASDPRFVPCVTSKFMTFGIGRQFQPVKPNDKAWVDYLGQQVGMAGGSLRTLIQKVVMSEAFRSRQAAVSP